MHSVSTPVIAMQNTSTSLSIRSLLRWYLITAICLVVIGLIIFLILKLFPTTLNGGTEESLRAFFNLQFFIFLLVGFLAQLIDGALGMAYGISSTTFLMSTGIPPVVASASVHISEVFTTGASGIAHWKFGNIDKTLFKKLIIPGALGAALGAYVLSSFDGTVMKPYVSTYLIIMGVVIIVKSFKKKVAFREPKRVGWLALLGGFADASGGGGWGPVVTATLIGRGNNPRLTIGTVNAVEFFVALTASGIFTVIVGIDSWQIIAGLILGGIIAAPVGALITQKINVKASMIFVGILIILLSARTVVMSFL